MRKAKINAELSEQKIDKSKKKSPKSGSLKKINWQMFSQIYQENGKE